MLHQRARAVLPRTHRNALAVEHGRDVVGMRGAVEREGEDRGLVRSGALQVQPVEPAEPRRRVIPQVRLVRGDRCHPEAAQVVERDAEADLLHDRGRPGLEHHRRVGIENGVLAHLADHVAAAVERAHLGHPLGPDEDRPGA